MTPAAFFYTHSYFIYSLYPLLHLQSDSLADFTPPQNKSVPDWQLYRLLDFYIPLSLIRTNRLSLLILSKGKLCSGGGREGAGLMHSGFISCIYSNAIKEMLFMLNEPILLSCLYSYKTHQDIPHAHYSYATFTLKFVAETLEITSLVWCQSHCHKANSAHSDEISSHTVVKSVQYGWWSKISTNCDISKGWGLYK